MILNSINIYVMYVSNIRWRLLGNRRDVGVTDNIYVFYFVIYIYE